MAEAGEAGGDAAVAPCRVVGGHVDAETAQLHTNAGPAGRVESSGGRFGAGATPTRSQG